MITSLLAVVQASSIQCFGNGDHWLEIREGEVAAGWCSHNQSLCGSYLWALTVPVIATLLQSAECGPHGLRNNICREGIGLKEFVTTEGIVQVVEVDL